MMQDRINGTVLFKYAKQGRQERLIANKRQRAESTRGQVLQYKISESTDISRPDPMIV